MSPDEARMLDQLERLVAFDTQNKSIGATGTVIGPGSIDVAHKPDEFVPRDQFIRSALIYKDIAERMLRS